MRVTVERLGKAYGFLWALRELNLEVSPGEFIALLGPNGAGKTTFLKLLAGLTAPTTGTIRFDGANFSRGAAALRARIGLLTPAEHLYDGLTLKENLAFFTGLYRRNSGAAAIDAALAQVNLHRRSGDYVETLSSGMKCRLSIAKWLLLEPELLLIDEPYGVLDGTGIDLLESFLKDRCARGGIVVMASHHVSRALDLCGRALVLSQGRLTFDETKCRPWPSFDRAFADFLPRGGS